MIYIETSEWGYTLAHLINPEYIVCVDEMPTGSIVIRLENGLSYTTETYNIGDIKTLIKDSQEVNTNDANL